MLRQIKCESYDDQETRGFERNFDARRMEQNLSQTRANGSDCPPATRSDRIQARTHRRARPDR
jgi:hypothetical protein